MPQADQTLTKPTRRERTEGAILEAALDVFSRFGFRGATLDQIAEGAGVSKPNLLYYFSSKEDIHQRLLADLLELWLAPLEDINPNGKAAIELHGYIRRKLNMSREFPRESRLFANEILNGAPRLEGFLRDRLRPLVESRAAVLARWMDDGQIARVDPMHLLFSIWALTQHYADFATQISIVSGHDDPTDGAEAFLEQLYLRLLTPR